MFTCPASLFLEPQMRAIEQVGFLCPNIYNYSEFN